MPLTHRQQLVLLIPFMAVVIPFLLCPAVLGFAASFTNYAPFQPAAPVFIGLHNYERVFGDESFITSIRNTAVFTFLTVSAELVIGVAVAYALRRSFRGRSLLRFVLLLPWLISPAASGVMWHQLLSSERGLLNFWPTLLRLPPVPYPLVNAPFAAVIAVEVWRKFPLVTFLALPGIESIPAVQWDMARLDGLSIVGRLRHVVLPRLRLLLLTIGLLLVGDALGISESVFFLTGGGPGVQTSTIGLYSYAKAIRASNWSFAAIPGWITVVVVLLLGAGYIYFTRPRDNAHART
ncbi:MAG: sugar ABC transporter permease [Anaerolineae bacterium]